MQANQPPSQWIPWGLGGGFRSLQSRHCRIIICVCNIPVVNDINPFPLLRLLCASLSLVTSLHGFSSASSVDRDSVALVAPNVAVVLHRCVCGVAVVTICSALLSVKSSRFTNRSWRVACFTVWCVACLWCDMTSEGAP